LRYRGISLLSCKNNYESDGLTPRLALRGALRPDFRILLERFGISHRLPAGRLLFQLFDFRFNLLHNDSAV